ncbi:MAG: autoinducer synthase [Methylocystis sp.]|nr:autoinducer synthase [Methylocystis sp.]
MIRLIQGIMRSHFQRDIDAMHRNRAQVFACRLGWDVNVVDGWEIDKFDDANPLYLISIDPLTGNYCGSTRLLSTTGPNMLRDVFSQLLPDGEIVESATIWEGTRFAVDLSMETERVHNHLNRTTGELLCGAFEVGLMAGLTHIVAVFDVRMARVFKLARCPAEIIGTPRLIGKTMTYAGFFEVSEQMLARVRSAIGVTGSILESATVKLLPFAA